jgi:hypothetical protein
MSENQSLRHPKGMTFTPFLVVNAIGAFAQMIMNEDGIVSFGIYQQIADDHILKYMSKQIQIIVEIVR